MRLIKLMILVYFKCMSFFDAIISYEDGELIVTQSNGKKQRFLTITAVLMVLALVIFVLAYAGFSGGKKIQVNAASPEKAVKDEAVLLKEGVDVSHFQGDIDWPQVAHTKQFAYIKATQGTGFKDPNYVKNILAIAQTPLFYGSYHFFDASQDSIQQAEYFLATIKGYKQLLAPMLDVESASLAAKDKESIVALQKAASLWLEYVEQKTGCTPYLYSNASFYQEDLANIPAQYPLWIADYGAKPSQFSDLPGWQLWQYSQSGEVQGIQGSVDLDRFVVEKRVVPGGDCPNGL